MIFFCTKQDMLGKTNFFKIFIKSKGAKGFNHLHYMGTFFNYIYIIDYIIKVVNTRFRVYS